jgi:hypothetical protein
MFGYGNLNSDFNLDTVNYIRSVKPGAGNEGNSGVFGVLQANYWLGSEFTVVSGIGGLLGADGGSGFVRLPGYIQQYSTYGKTGRAGFAVKDGIELITWAQRGYVRGDEY